MTHKDHTLQNPAAYIPRDYRRLVHSGLNVERIVVQETDLTIYSDNTLATEAKASVILHRGYVENYIHNHPRFARTLTPWPQDPLAPAVVREMVQAAQRAGVGPMAAVAGAIAEKVGHDLLAHASQVIVENGGDVFISARGALTTGIFAGPSPLSMKIGIRLHTLGHPLALCTSSASVGHSLSLGRADAACVLSESCAVADAVATALGNRIARVKDIQPAIDWAKSIAGVKGVLVILGTHMGAWGGLEVVPI